MTLREWVKLEALIASNWPNAKLMDADEVRLRHQIVADLPNDAAATAIVKMARAGREFPPTPGQLYASASQALRPPAPAPGAIIDLLCRAASTFGANRELDAVRWLAGESPHAARFAVEHGWRQFCREGLFDPQYGGAVRQRIERSAESCAAGLEREFREDRVLPLVSDHLARLGRGEEARSGLRPMDLTNVVQLRPALPETTADELSASAGGVS